MTFEEAAEKIWLATQYEVSCSDDCLIVYDDYFQNGKRIIEVHGQPRCMNDIHIDWVTLGKSSPTPFEIDFMFRIFRELINTKGEG